MAKKIIFIAVFGALAIFLAKQIQRQNEPLAPFTNGQIPFEFPEMKIPEFLDNTCDISRYGGIADGASSNTLAFQKAINDCSQKGGGKVLVPAGKWVTGAIHLKSGIDLHLEKEAEIIFSADPEDYLPVVFTRFEGIELYNYSPLIYARGERNIAITGKGTLNGQGQAWQTWKKGETPAMQKLYQMSLDNLPVEERIFGTTDLGLRPSFMQFVDCRGIWLENFSIIDSPRWTIHPVYSENVVMRNLNISTSGFNADGIVIDSSKNVLIENSRLATSDDTISIKSGLNEDGWRVNRPSENIVIRNSDISDGHSGIAIGSEMSGGIDNVFLENLKLSGVNQGICVKSLKGRGGQIENVWIKDISMGDIKNVAFEINLDYNASTIKPAGSKIPLVKNFYINGLSVNKTGLAINLRGLKDSLIENINFWNFEASADKGVLVKNSKNINFDKIDISGTQPPIFKVSDSQSVRY